ncbi:plasma membrane-associated cation-binding protein 1 [Tanacetum coccineum]
MAYVTTSSSDISEPKSVRRESGVGLAFCFPWAQVEIKGIRKRLSRFRKCFNQRRLIKVSNIGKEFEEKKAEFEAKVKEIYEATTDEIKAVVKERKEERFDKDISLCHDQFLAELYSK